MGIIMDKETGESCFTFADHPPKGFFEMDGDRPVVTPKPLDITYDGDLEAFSFADEH